MKYNLARNTLVAYAIRHKGNWEAVYAEIKNRDVPTSEELGKADKTEAVTILDENYPERMKKATKAPFVLFVHEDGKIDLNDTAVHYVQDATAAYVDGNGADIASMGLVQQYITNKGEAYCQVAKGKVTIVKGGKKTVLSHLPKGTTAKPMDCIYSRIWVAGLAVNAYFFKLKPNCPDIQTLAAKVSQGNGEAFVLPRPLGDENVNNRLIWEGASPLVILE